MANKTKAQKYNERLEKIFKPEIERLEKVEVISREVLASLRKIVEIEPQGDNDCFLVNAITDVIKIYIKI